jgi:galactokinase
MSDIRDDTLSGFQQIFGYDAHGLWSAPGELSLLGDDSDYADGYVLSIAINRRTAVAAGVRKDRKLRVASTEADEIAEISLDSLEPDAVHGWAAYPLGVAWALGQFGADIAGVPGLDLLVDSDVPVGVGLGSSAALETAIAVALNDAWQLSLDTTTLARVTQRAEKSVVGRTTGLGDHIPSFVAEDDSAILFDSRSLDYDPVKLHMQDAELAILVIDTGIERAEPLDPVRFSEREQAVDAMGIPSLRDLSPKTLPEHRDKLSETVYRRAQHIVNENHRVLDAVKALRNDGVHALGDIIQASQSSLRDDYDASCAEIDLAIETALTNGALGARMIGLGNSGTVYALLDESTVSRVLVGLDGAFAEHGFQVPATYVVGPSRGALRH